MIQVYNSKAVGAEDAEFCTRVRWPVPNIISQIYSLGKVRPAVRGRHVYTYIYTCDIMKIGIRSGKYDLPHLVKQALLKIKIERKPLQF